ncbi:MAG: radical SAM protein [Pyrinomonadaceae bacterium]
MSTNEPLDCVVIGYNEVPFGEYERLLGQYGADSEAYRDLQYSFVEVAGRKLDYMGLLNHVYGLAGVGAPEFKSCDIPNLAAVYLDHFLRRSGHRSTYVNLFQHERAELGRLLDRDPVCVAITTTFYVMNNPVTEMVRFIRERNPRTKIVVGGPLVANHARNYQGHDDEDKHDHTRPISLRGPKSPEPAAERLDPEFAAALEDIGADIYVHEAQGELTLARVVERLKASGDLAGVPNLIYSEGGRFRVTAKMPESNSLDESFIDWRAYAGRGLGPTLQTRTARSCAFNCSFCNYPTRAGKLTLAGLDTLEKELDSMHSLGGVRNVVFIDDTFNVPLPRFKEICRLMIRKRYGFDWFSYFRCSNSDEEAVELLAESGCKGVFLGIESGSPAILQNMNKAATIEKYARGMEMLHDRGVITFASLIFGFPGETEETVAETVNFIRETRPTFYRGQLWYCETGTPIERQRERFGISGEGFVWRHATMDSLQAMDHLDRAFLTIKESTWLPQWSFDFWAIPYLLGLGVSAGQLKALLADAHGLLRLEIAAVPPSRKSRLQQTHLDNMALAAAGRLGTAARGA